MSRAPNGTGTELGNRGRERKQINVVVNPRTHAAVSRCQAILVEQEQRAVGRLEVLDKAVAHYLEHLHETTQSE